MRLHPLLRTGATALVSALSLAACGGGDGEPALVLAPAPGAIIVAPRAVDGARTFTTLAVGFHHACALDGNGAAWCWGSNEYGQLGTTAALPRCDGGATPCSPAPIRVESTRAFVAIGASLRHTCALEATGEAWCWGFGIGGQLGDGRAADSTVPVRVATSTPYAAIALGGSGLIACALDARGGGECWGPGGGGGGLGNGTTGGANAPVTVAAPAPLTAIAVGDDHACAIAAGGAAYCWGHAGFGKLGTGTPGASSVPAPVAGGIAFERVAAGLSHTCALAADGRAYCWGQAASIGSVATGHVASPAAVAGGRAYGNLAAGAEHTCALDRTGAAWCWGRNLAGQLGDGTVADHAAPVAVGGARSFDRIRAGGGTTCALDAGGLAWCWGDDTFGQAGRVP